MCCSVCLWTPCLHGCGVWDLQRAGSYSSLGDRKGGQCGGSRVGRTGRGTVGGRKLLIGKGKKGKNCKVQESGWRGQANKQSDMREQSGAMDKEWKQHNGMDR